MLAEKSMEPMFIEDLDGDVYHSDPSSVSSTGLRKILKSPAWFKAEHIDGFRQPETDAMRFGSLVHQAVLEGGKFLSRYVVEPEFSGLTKDGRESKRSKDALDKRAAWAAEQMMEGNIVVTQEDFDNLRGMLDSVISHRDAFALLKDSIREVSGYWRDEQTGIKCRIRPDILNLEVGALVDLKTTNNCEEHSFSRSIWDYRFDLQSSMYSDGVTQIWKKKMQFHAFIAVEKQRPWDCAVYTADEALLEIGHRDYRRALDRLKSCIDSGVWPGYQTSIQNISLPHFAIQGY